MANPIVTSITSSISNISESDNGSTVTFTVVFDQPMNTQPSVTPALSFPVEIPAGAISYSSGEWNLAGTTYTFTYNIFDNDLDLADIDIKITTAENFSGEPLLDNDIDNVVEDVFSIDTLIADAPAADLDAASDAGVSDTDNDTNDDTPTFEIVLPATGIEEGDTVQLVDVFGTVVGTYTVGPADAGGPISITTGTLADGTHDISVKFLDPAGNERTSVAALSVTIDTTADEGGDLTVTIADTDINNSEKGAAAFTIAGLDVDVNTAVVTFSDGVDTVTVDVSAGDGPYVVDLSTLADGTITSSIEVTDMSGNTATTTGLDMELDTTADVGGDLDITIADTDINNSEKATVAFTIAGLDGDVDTATVTFSDGVDTVVVDISGGNGAYTVDLTSLADGVITSTVLMTDTSGNTASVTGTDIALDTTADEGDDLSVTISDTLVNDAEKTNVAFDIAGLDGDLSSATVTFSDGSNTVIVDVSGGNGPYVVDLTALDDGTITAELAVEDTSGNTATAAGADIELDTVAPDAPVVLLDHDTEGTGINDATPTIYGTGDVGDTITIYLDLGLGPALLTVVIVDGSGNWSATPPIALVPEIGTDSIIFSARATDPAGNVSSVSADATLNLDFVPEIVGLTDNGVAGDAANNGTGTVVELVDGDVDEGTGTLFTTGDIAFEDISAGQAHTVVVTPPASSVGVFTAGVSNQTTVDTDGIVTWEFVVNDSVLEAMGADDSVSQTFTIRIQDDNGDFSDQDITIVLQGSNDGPVISSVVSPAAVVEDADASAQVLSTSGSFDVTDADIGGTIAGTVFGADVLTASVSGNATAMLNGSLVSGAEYTDLIAAGNITFPTNAIDADGTAQGFTFDYDATANVDFLADGETLVLTYTVEISDGNGGSDTTPVTITLTGTNDAPVISGASVDTATEDGSVVNGSVAGTASDVDASDTLTFTLDTPIAGLTMNPDGTWSFDPSDAAYQSLAVGDTTDVVVNYSVSDGNGGLVGSTLTITVTGTNDVPVISGPSTDVATEDAATVSGSVAGTASDVDTGAVLNFTLDVPVDGMGMLSDGSWTFDPTDAAYQSLQAGETIDVIVAYTVTDENSASVSSTLTITVTGTNDVPVITGDITGSATEPGDGVAGTTATGTIAVADVDDDESGTEVVTDGVSDLGYGTFTVDASGNWEFTVDEESLAVQALAVGDTLVETFTVTSFDGSASQEITVTINGSNDAPFVVDETGLSATIVEIADNSVSPAEGDILTAEATIIFDDFEEADTHSVSITPSGPNAASYIGTFSGGFETGATGPGTGTIQWDFSIDDDLIEGLSTDDEIIQTYELIITDNNGATTTEVVTITIQGTDDVPIISSVINPVAITEDADASAQALATSGSFDVTDDDIGGAIAGLVFDADVLTASVTGNATAMLNGSLVSGAEYTALIAAGNITFPVNGIDTDGTAQSFVFNYNATADVDFLAVGETLVLTYTVEISDGSGGTDSTPVTITLTGTNDAPVVSGTSTGSATEDGAVATGSVAGTASDADNSDTLTFALVVPVAGLTMNPDGSWSFDASGVAFQSLAVGETADVVVGYNVSDGNGGSVSSTLTITVTGTNDAPVISGTSTGSATEDGAIATGSVAGTASDVDTSDTLGFTLDAPVAGLTMLSDGSWSFDPSDAAYQSLSTGETLDVVASYTVDDGEGGTASSTLTITVTGTNEIFVGTSGDDNIVGTTSGDDIDGLAGDDVLAGLEGDDFIFGDTGEDFLKGGAGDDVLNGGDNNDKLKGGIGSDQLFGGKGADKLIGGDQADQLFGAQGADRLKGGKGADELTGGKGNDKLSGGKGIDTFIFNGDSDNGKDHITDFKNGSELIEISGSTVYSDLSISKSNGNTVIKWDDNTIILDDVTGKINANDFDFV